MKIAVIHGKNQERYEAAGVKPVQRKSVKVGIRTRFLFWFYGGMQKANWGASPSEKEYWESRGWLNGVKPWR